MSPVTDFKEHLQRLGYSAGSRRMLPACVEEFLCFTGPLPLASLTRVDLEAYRGYLERRPNKRRPGALSEMMIYHHFYALRLFFDYLEQAGDLVENPASGLSLPAPRHAPRVILTLQEVEQLFTAAGSLTARAVLHVCYSCGLRRMEALQLATRDVHFRDQVLYVRSGKGSKRRAIPLTDRVAGELKLYCHHERPERLTGPAEAFLLNRQGGRMQGGTLYKTLQSLQAAAGLCSPVTPHGLRHAIATHLLQGGLSLEYVRDFLGHEHLETTQLYTHIAAV